MGVLILAGTMIKYSATSGRAHAATGKEDKNRRTKQEMTKLNPVIATILMVAIAVVLAGVLYVWAANLAESNMTVALAHQWRRSRLNRGHHDHDSGSDLGWASITIKASVDGAASVTVDQCASGETDNCWSSTDGDADNWNVGEAITVDTDCTGLHRYR